MFERDYLTRLFCNLAAAIRKTIFKENKDPRGSAATLEAAISNATDIDGDALLSLAPESMASILQVTGTDPRVCGYIAHTLFLESQYLEEAKENDLAAIRRAQAEALAQAYGVDLNTTEAALNDLIDRYPEEE